MLQSLRDNLKGTVAVFVIIIFVVPLVLFGVEQLFVGSVGGSDAATVNGEGISQREFQRQLVLEKERLQQQFELEPNSPELEDSELSGPVLQRMVQREALVQAAREAGMGASRDLLWRQIADIEAFQVDGRFNEELFKQRISFAYTPATFLEATAEDLLLNHLNAGVAGSGFVSATDVETLAAITNQTRTFFTVEIPQAEQADVAISDEEVEAYYEENIDQFTSPEQVSVDYVEIDVDALADSVSVPEEDIRAVYEDEVANFSASAQIEVAHILLEEPQQGLIDEISQKLEQGESFSELAQQYSDDLGSKAQGGELGRLVEEAFPQPFVEAAKSLDVGEVSAPTQTEAGTHFIKVLEKSDANPPTLEERRAVIERQLARQTALDDYVQRVATLEEATFGADSLARAAEALDIEVQTSAPFSRQGGSGIAGDRQVVNAAFAEDVLREGHNSRVLELSDNRAIVLRLNEHQPEQRRPLAEVRPQIEEQLREQKQRQILAEEAAKFRAKLDSAESVQTLAEQAGYNFAQHDNVKRTAAGIDNAILQKAFSLPRPDADPVVDQVIVPRGSVSVIGLQAVADGSADSLGEQQLAAIRRQLLFQLGQAEMQAFEDAVIAEAEIKVQ